MIRVSVLCCLLAGCAAVPPVTITKLKMVQPNIPDALLTCPSSPAVPVAIQQSQVADYVAVLWRAHAICYDHLTAVRHALQQPTVTH